MNLIQQIDSLNFEDPHFQQKSIDLDMRLNTIYDKLADVETLIETSESKREVILKDKMTADNIYKILVNFASFMDVMEDIDKKRLCQMLIEKVEIYDEKNEAGRWVKAIHFKLPIIEEDLKISLDNSTPVEAVVKLSKRDINHHIDLEINEEDLKDISVKKDATYSEIKDYVFRKFELKVSTLNIAQVKRKLGIIERENYNHSKKENQRVPNCPPKKEQAIIDALSWFGMIG